MHRYSSVKGILLKIKKCSSGRYEMEGCIRSYFGISLRNSGSGKLNFMLSFFTLASAMRAANSPMSPSADAESVTEVRIWNNYRLNVMLNLKCQIGILEPNSHCFYRWQLQRRKRFLWISPYHILKQPATCNDFSQIAFNRDPFKLLYILPLFMKKKNTVWCYLTVSFEISHFSAIRTK